MRRYTISSGLIRLTAVLLAVSTTACGFVFSHGPPRGHEAMEQFRCTEGTTPPVLDIVWGGLVIATTVAILVSPDDSLTTGQAVGGGVFWAGLAGAAAVVGFNKAARCEEALDMRYAREEHTRTLADSFTVARLRSRGSTVASVVITPPVDTIAVGARRQLVASAHASSGAPVTQTFEWSSSNAAVASVSAAGLVTAIARGRAVISASADSVVGTATIVVVPRR